VSLDNNSVNVTESPALPVSETVPDLGALEALFLTLGDAFEALEARFLTLCADWSAGALRIPLFYGLAKAPILPVRLSIFDFRPMHVSKLSCANGLVQTP